MKIYLIRHGQTTGDVENRYGGTYDDHLSDEGKMQAESLAKRLQNTSISKIYFSPLNRAKETALILQKICGSQLEEIPQLKERNNYGILTGMEKSEARKIYPQLVALLENDHNTIADAEPFDEFRERILVAFHNITNDNQKTIAIVTHGGPIKVILKEFLERNINKIEDCAYALIEKTENGLSLQQTEGIKYS